VPTGTRLVVRTEDPLDSSTATPGDLFSARLEQPLRGSDGRVLVPAGAAIRAHVISTEELAAPRLLVQFDSIVTPEGESPLAARVRRAEVTRYPGARYASSTVNRIGSAEQAARWAQQGGGTGSYFYNRHNARSNLGTGGGPWAYEGRRGSERGIHVPAGALLELELLAPLTTTAGR
jgi:hypothetical protein